MAETTEQYRARINQLKTSIENEPLIKEMRDDIAEGVSKTGNRQADIEVQFQSVIDGTTGKDVISAPEIIAARNGETNLKTRLDKKEQEVTAQLEKTEQQKVGGGVLAAMSDLSQEVKESMTGGSVAVVGSGAVNYTTLASDLKENLSDLKTMDVTMLDGYIARTTGIVSTEYSGYLHVKLSTNPGETFYFSGSVAGNAIALAVFYDASGTFVSAYKPGTTPTVYVNEPILVPTGVRTIGISANNTHPITIKKKSIVNISDVTADIANLENDTSILKTSLSVVTKNQAEISKDKSPYYYDGAVVVFVDDDARVEFVTQMKPVLDLKGVKATLGVITGRVGNTGSLTKEALIELQEDGHEIVSHSKTHTNTVFTSNSSSVTDEQIETEYKDSRDWLIQNGFFGYDTFVFPYGGFADSVRFKALARKYYTHALNSGYGLGNPIPYDNMFMHRKFMNITQNIDTQIKPLVDTALTNKELLIFGSHSFNSAEFTPEYLASIIDYVQSLNIPILTLGEALKIKGNVLSVGEFTSNNKFYVGANGNVDMGTY